jgi:hypothetical protein
MEARPTRAIPRTRPGARGHAELAERLWERREEIEEAVIARIEAIPGAGRDADPTYLDGLYSAVRVAIDYGLSALGSTERLPPVSVALLAQARLAARSGVSLDTVLRRYFAGYAILSDHILEQATGLLEESQLKGVLRSQGTLFDRLLAAVSAEYSREAESLPSRDQDRAQLVKRLLGGELLGGEALNYDFGTSHLGAVATGSGAPAALRDLSKDLGCRLLLVQPEPETTWAWMAGEHQLGMEGLMSLAASRWPADSALAFGEPGPRIAGWRQTHRQAAAALPIAVRSSPTIVRYGDVALLATALKDNILSTSLQRLFLKPLQAGRQGGEVARQTLLAYLDAECNVSSAAASLRVKRHTVTSRLREIETAIGRPIGPNLSNIELALRLDELLGKEAANR